MSDAFEIPGKPVSFRVEGLRKTIRDLERAGAQTQDMRELMHSLGSIVVRAADAPVLTGRLASTIRAGKGKTKAVVRAGGARARYAGVRHYGWPARNIEPARFLVEALQETREQVFDELDQGIAAILQRNGLDPSRR